MLFNIINNVVNAAIRKSPGDTDPSRCRARLRSARFERFHRPSIDKARVSEEIAVPVQRGLNRAFREKVQAIRVDRYRRHPVCSGHHCLVVERAQHFEFFGPRDRDRSWIPPFEQAYDDRVVCRLPADVSCLPDAR